MNVRSGGLILYVDAETQSYILGVARSEIAPGSSRVNVIGSVGMRARWNDDIGESGFATLTLGDTGGP